MMTIAVCMTLKVVESTDDNKVKQVDVWVNEFHVYSERHPDDETRYRMLRVISKCLDEQARKAGH